MLVGNKVDLADDPYSQKIIPHQFYLGRKRGSYQTLPFVIITTTLFLFFFGLPVSNHLRANFCLSFLIDTVFVYISWSVSWLNDSGCSLYRLTLVYVCRLSLTSSLYRLTLVYVYGLILSEFLCTLYGFTLSSPCNRSHHIDWLRCMSMIWDSSFEF